MALAAGESAYGCLPHARGGRFRAGLQQRQQSSSSTRLFAIAVGPRARAEHEMNVRGFCALFARDPAGEMFGPRQSLLARFSCASVCRRHISWNIGPLRIACARNPLFAVLCGPRRAKGSAPMAGPHPSAPPASAASRAASAPARRCCPAAAPACSPPAPAPHRRRRTGSRGRHTVGGYP